MGLLILLSTAGLGQLPNNFRQLSKSEGLSQSSVFDIAQNDEGFMWFGTRDGLNRYDGHEFLVYRTDSAGLGPSGNDVRALRYDSATRNLWIGTTDGPNRYSSRLDRFFAYPEADHAIRDIFISPQGTVWFGGSQGIYRYDVSGDSLISIQLDLDEFAAGGVNALGGTDGSLWLGTEAGLIHYQNDGLGGSTAKRVTLTDQGQDEPPATAVHVAESGAIYVGTFNRGLFELSPSGAVRRHFRHDPTDPQSLSHDNVRDLTPNHKGGLYVATFRGLGLLDMATGALSTSYAKVQRNGELSDNSVRASFIDDRGSLWVGTYHGGVNLQDRYHARFKSYVPTPDPNSLSTPTVSSFAEDEEGNLYIGTEGGGLEFLERASGKFYHYPPFGLEGAGATHVGGPNVKSLLLDGDSLWIGHYSRGLDLLHIPSGRFEHFRSATQRLGVGKTLEKQLSHDNVYALLKRGHELWAGTYGGGISRLDLRTGTFDYLISGANQQKLPALRSDFVRVLVAHGNDVLVGSDGGIERIRLDGFGEPKAVETVLKGARVQVIHIDDKQRIWAGAAGMGLIRIDPTENEHVTYTQADGLPGNTVFGILPDSAGRLWLSTNNGLARFDPESGLAVSFSSAGRLPSGEFNFGAFKRLSTGEMVFGGVAGFTRFDPEAMESDGASIPIAFTNFQHNGGTVRPGTSELLEENINQVEELTLRYDDASFAIGITALDYLQPQSTHLQYRLKGLETAWSNARGSVVANYTIQREGDYLLEVRRTDGTGGFLPVERQLAVTVLPPPWRSSAAYITYVLLLGLGLFAIYRFVKLRYRYRLEQFEHHRDAELHEGKLRFFTNITHEFRTPLTLIVGPLQGLIHKFAEDEQTSAQLRLVDRNAKKLLDLVNRVLTFRTLSSEHGRLRATELELNWFLRKLHEVFNAEARRRSITLSLDIVPGSLHIWGDAGMLEMAITSLLSNALKFTPDGGRISLSAKLVGSNEYTITVSDNGRGVPDELKPNIFQRYFEDSSKSATQGSGLGLAVANELIALHGGTLSVEDTPGGGATFVLLAPTDATKPDTVSLGSSHEIVPLVATPAAQLDAPAKELEAPALGIAADNASFKEARLSERRRILIVEDNPELRSYICSILEEEHDVVSAPDGRQALAITRGKVAPDLVVSDVMMPEMDGLELCRTLKSELSTSHIPVLLLTARTGDVARLEGLRLGADAYVPKPFAADELRLRIRNLISTRDNVRAAFSKTLNLEPAEVTVTSVDEQFLTDALAFVEERIEQVDLSVVEMAAALNVSRALLFTKMKALTNRTPATFIKEVRLKRAAQLLATGKLNVSEVAYRVGYRNPKYFSKCFKIAYSETAAGYKRRHGEMEEAGS